MGKIKKSKRQKPSIDPNLNPTTPSPLDTLLENHTFDDTKSVRSMKSLKNDLGIKQISKINKRKLRQKVFMNKITVKILGAKNSGRTKPNDQDGVRSDPKSIVNDSLPSLGLLTSLLVSKDQIKVETKSKKGIPKLGRRKRDLVEGVKIYKSVLANGNFKTDPIGSILQEVKQRLESKEF